MNARDHGEKRPALLAFGHLLKRLRIAADLTQEELAERAIVSARSISDLERGSSHRPRRDTVRLLADGLRLRGAERESFIALARGHASTATTDPATVTPPRMNVPHPPTAIVGRLKETAAATALMLDPEVRLLTLTGPGGVGKTRLALEVAFRAAEAMPDGAVFVDLAPIRDARLVISVIAHALGIVASPEIPLRQAVQAYLREKSLLLILDNFEQVPASATDVAELLADAPGVTILVTSRTPLHVLAEREYEIGPLSLPEAPAEMTFEDLSRVPAVELFVRQAEVANRAFAISPSNARDIAEITIRLDGLPLAIELAATRMKILSPAALLARMEQRLPLLTRGAHDLPIRQQAMRATLDWSYDLLSADEKTLFCQLSVFAGGCTVDAAEWLSGAGRVAAEAEVRNGAGSDGRSRPATSSPTFALDLLADLVDKSLLSAQADLDDEQRFRMLETIREYGLERLSEAGEAAAARSSHLAWCIDLVERAEPKLLGAEQHHWFLRLGIEQDNLRVALGWAIAQGDAEAALRLSGSLYRFWGNHGHYEEGRRWLEQSLAIDPQTLSSWRGNALIGLGVMTFFQGEYTRAAALWEESLALFTALENPVGVAYSHGNLGLVADAREDYPRATASYEAALALFRELEDVTYIGFMLHNLGLIAYFEENYARARGLFQESLELAKTLEDENSIAMVLGNLGLVAIAEGDFRAALALQREALANWKQISNKPWLARSIEHFAMIAAASGEPQRAATLFGAAAAQRVAFSSAQPPNDQEINQGFIARARNQLGQQGFREAWNAGELQSLDEAIAYALGECEIERQGAAGDAQPMKGEPLAREDHRR